MGCCSSFRLGNESTGRAPERGGCSQIVIFTWTPPSCSGAVLHVEVPENNSEPGSLVVQRRAANGLGLGSALRRGGAISVPSLTLVLAQVAGGGSGGIPGGSGSPGEIDFPQRLGARNATDVGPVHHDTHAATAVLTAHRAVCRPSDRGGVGSSGRRRRFRARFIACLLCGIRVAPTACARDGGLQWP
ncbi:hypothetical protein TcBrA4_0032140 [Trypanosoma cruzi]|nr:hypothetical protein TcBrA4_0092190 [Trypanosoma cruzi]KAF8296963.1 hypothetical protein TcBrA4_0069050 [Trypanosoma cruzi]KAF8296966.1 hypothetical protein TcBrA4_0069080 [Trypanosoma cruzi]KAF8306303.1 hypothetical protein TcBrA4_0032140 [Trypanosoma cruzi]